MKYIFATLFLMGIICSQQQLVEVASSKHQWTGIAVSKEGRIFVNFPRWRDQIPMSVGEVLPSGKVKAYPDLHWNGWSKDLVARDRFVCVQSVYVDKKNYLWILDPANPNFAGVVENGPKLLKVNLDTNSIVKVYFFEKDIAKKNSYLNDIRVDTDKQIAYLTDSGDGALILLDLRTGKARRVLDSHYSTEAEDVVLTIENQKWLMNGKAPKIHSDGIALDDNGEYIYYQALTGKHLYRIRTRALLDETLSSEELEKHVQLLGATGAADGIIFDSNDNLYISSLEHSAILRLTPGLRVEYVAQDSNISWPDSFSIGPDGYLYFTTAQIHLGENPKNPYRIYKIKIAPRMRSKNEIFSFVYHWFSLFDKNAPFEDFVPLLSGTSLSMEFPDTSFASVAAFKNWYSLVLSQVKKASHDIEKLDVKITSDGNYDVHLIVHWQGETHDGNIIRFTADQNWTLIETEEQYPRISRYAVKEAVNAKAINKIKQKISNKEAVFGGFVTISDSKVIENMCVDKKLDFIWLEAEHTEMGVKDVQELVRTCENEGVVPVVRVAKNEMDHIKQYIGTGVKGVIVPRVNNAEDVQRVVDATKYPPLGKRTVGVERGNSYLGKLQEYLSYANDAVMTVIMIETPEAVENIEKIAQVKGVDLWHIGPFDLSVAMGVSLDSAELRKAIMRVEQIAEEYGIPLGSYAPNIHLAKNQMKKGYFFFTVPGDMQLLQEGIHNFFKEEEK